jgi:hypothetical protein
LNDQDRANIYVTQLAIATLARMSGHGASFIAELQKRVGLADVQMLATMNTDEFREHLSVALARITVMTIGEA